MASSATRSIAPPCDIEREDAVELVGVPASVVANFITRRPYATVCDYMKHALSLPLRPRNIISTGTYGTAVALTSADGNVRAVAKFIITSDDPEKINEPYTTSTDEQRSPLRSRIALDAKSAEREAQRTNAAARSLNTLANKIVPKAIDFFFSEREDDPDIENAIILIEYADGQSLYRAMNNIRDEHGAERLIDFVQRMGVEIGRSLRVMHNHGMVHGDLSVSNIIVRPAANAISIIDWSQMVQAGEARSPQQWARFRIFDALGPARHVLEVGGLRALAAYFAGLQQSYPDIGVSASSFSRKAPFPLRTNVSLHGAPWEPQVSAHQSHGDAAASDLAGAQTDVINDGDALKAIWTEIWNEASLQTRLVDRDLKFGAQDREVRAAMTRGSNELQLKSPVFEATISRSGEFSIISGTTPDVGTVFTGLVKGVESRFTVESVTPTAPHRLTVKDFGAKISSSGVFKVSSGLIPSSGTVIRGKIGVNTRTYTVRDVTLGTFTVEGLYTDGVQSTPIYFTIVSVPSTTDAEATDPIQFTVPRIGRLQLGARLRHPNLPIDTRVHSIRGNVVAMTEAATESDANALIKIETTRHIQPRTGREDEFLADLHFNQYSFKATISNDGLFTVTEGTTPSSGTPIRGTIGENTRTFKVREVDGNTFTVRGSYTDRVQSTPIQFTVATWYITVARGFTPPDVHSLISGKIDGRRVKLHVDDEDENGNLLLREDVSPDKSTRQRVHMWVLPYFDEQDERVQSAIDLRESIAQKDAEYIQFWNRMHRLSIARSARRAQEEIDRTIDELEQYPNIRVTAQGDATQGIQSTSSSAAAAAAPVRRRALASNDQEDESEDARIMQSVTAVQRSRGRQQQQLDRSDTPVPTFRATKSRIRGAAASSATR